MENPPDKKPRRPRFRDEEFAGASATATVPVVVVAADDDASRGTRRAPLEEIRRNITAAGLSPVERDGRFASLAG